MTKLTKEELIKKLKEIPGSGGDEEIHHQKADNLLLEFIDDIYVTEAFDNIPKWYA